MFKDTTFRTLNGPDPDGDGVGANEDACPSAKGTLGNGCLPGVQDDPDQDGVYGAADVCPSLAGNGALNGCPGGIVPNVTTPEIKTLVATLKVKRGFLFKKASLSKGRAGEVRVHASTRRPRARSASARRSPGSSASRPRSGRRAWASPQARASARRAAAAA